MVSSPPRGFRRCPNPALHPRLQLRRQGSGGNPASQHRAEEEDQAQLDVGLRRAETRGQQPERAARVDGDDREQPRGERQGEGGEGEEDRRDQDAGDERAVEEREEDEVQVGYHIGEPD